MIILQTNLEPDTQAPYSTFVAQKAWGHRSHERNERRGCISYSASLRIGALRASSFVASLSGVV